MPWKRLSCGASMKARFGESANRQAGIWEGSLLYDLLWYVESQNCHRRPKVKRASDWRWALMEASASHGVSRDLQSHLQVPHTSFELFRDRYLLSLTSSQSPDLLVHVSACKFHVLSRSMQLHYVPEDFLFPCITCRGSDRPIDHLLPPK